MAPRILSIWLAVLLLAAAGCRSAPPPVLKEYPMRGVVVKLDDKNKTAVIKHERIEGFMEAMSMEFAVKDPAQFAKLKPDAEITAKIIEQDKPYDFWISEVLTVR